MTDQLRIGLVGFGTIGRPVAAALQTGVAGRAALVAVLVRDPGRLPPTDLAEFGPIFTDSFATCRAARLDWLVETGGQAALRQCGPAALRAGINLMPISVGALADPAFLAELRAAAEATGRQIRVPAGAIGALDILGSAAQAELTMVHLVSRKPPAALLPPTEAAAVTAAGRARCLFEGTARDAAPRFPENLNVCAALGLAGVGLDRTRVTVYADPAVDKNTHQVTAQGDFGEFTFTLANIPSATNPKTGRVTAWSVIRSLRNLTSPLVIGG